MSDEPRSITRDDVELLLRVAADYRTTAVDATDVEQVVRDTDALEVLAGKLAASLRDTETDTR